MGSASLFLLLSVVACVCVAAPRSNGASSTYINALAERSQHLRHRRDACSDALDKASQEPYSTCVQMLGPIEIGNPATKEAVTAYCTSSQDCPAKVKELFQGIGAACGGGGFPELETAIYDECAVDLRGIYCGIDYFAMFNDTTLEQANNNCISEFSSKQGCTDNCKTVVNYVLANTGCCYTVYEQFNNAIGNKVVSEDIFKACGQTEPDLC